jgi:transcriptional regulator with XRE-family HTH domain
MRSKLATRRKAKGYTQAQLAALVGTRKQRISLWETGVCMPSSPLLLALAAALDCAPADLFNTPKGAKEYRGANEYTCKGYRFRITSDLHPETMQRLYEIHGMKPANVPPYLCTIRECNAYIMQRIKPIDPGKLRAARKACGYTQAQLSEMLFISRTIISFWERGRFSPSGETLFLLADILGCSPDDLTRKEESESD